MTKNFEIWDGITIQHKLKEYDLHSEWLVSHLKIDKKCIYLIISRKNSTKTIYFKKCNIYSSPPTAPQNTHIEYIGYRYNDDFLIKNGFLLENKFESNMDIIIKFEKDDSPLRFSCEEALMED